MNEVYSWNLQIRVAVLISQILASNAAFLWAKDIRTPPIMPGATSARIARDLGILLKYVASRVDMMVTAPDGMFSNAASFGE